MKTRGMLTPAARAAAACSRASAAVMPLRSACQPARWMVAPAARGSLNGMPISAATHPALWAASSTATVSSSRGKPAVTYGISPGSRSGSAARMAAARRSPAGIVVIPAVLADRADVLVPPPREANEHDRTGRTAGGQLLGGMEGMAGLEGGDDPLESAEAVEGGQRLLVVRAHVAHPAAVAERAVLGADPRGVEPGADGVGGEHLAALILQEVAVRTGQPARPAAAERGGVLAAVQTAPRRLDPDQLDVLVVEEGNEHADGVAATADTRHHRSGQAAEPVQACGACLVADDPLQGAHQRRIGVRTDAAADHVMGVADVGHPVADRLVGGVLERARTTVDGHDGGAEEAHPVHVERLAAHVLAAHVHGAAEGRPGAGRCRGHAVLSGAGLGDDAALAHALRQQHLAERVVDLVRAGVEEVLALQPDLRAARRGAQSRRVGHRRGPAGVVPEKGAQLRLERDILERVVHRRLELIERRHDGLAYVGAAVAAESPASHGHCAAPCPVCSNAARAARTNAVTRAGSFTPGADSRPLDASTPAGRTRSIADATLAALRPPARMTDRKSVV